MTALHIAVGKERVNLDFIRFLIENGLHLEEKDHKV